MLTVLNLTQQTLLYESPNAERAPVFCRNLMPEVHHLEIVYRMLVQADARRRSSETT